MFRAYARRINRAWCLWMCVRGPLSPMSSGPNKKMFRACFNCGKSGHMADDCTKPNKQRDDSGRTNSGACNRCGERGHIAAECTGAQSGEQTICRICNGIGEWNGDFSVDLSRLPVHRNRLVWMTWTMFEWLALYLAVASSVATMPCCLYKKSRGGRV
jgi:hypothetical protein